MTRRRSGVGSVRLRITTAVTLLFGVSLSVAALAFVGHVHRSLVEDIYRADVSTLDQYNQTLTGVAVPTVLDPPSDRPGTALQVVDASGKVVGATPGAPTTPLDATLPPLAPAATATSTSPVRAGGTVPMRGPGGVRPPHGADGRPLPGQRPPPGPDGRPPGVVGQRPPRPVTAIVPNPVAAATVGAGDEVAISAVPVSTSTGDVHLIAATSLASVQRSVDTLRSSLLIVIPGLVAVIGVAAWLITGRALRPVRAITEQVEAISATTLHERVPVPRSDDEVGHLARTMNAMLERLETASVVQRRFVSDASHELRTPVSSIRVELEVALLHPEQTDWAEVAANILAEDDRLDQIVGDLLTLARFDESPSIDLAAAGDVDLDDVVREQLQRARPCVVVADQIPPLRVRGRADELSRMLGHLVDNAARHATSRVHIGLSRVGPPAGSPSPAPAWVLLVVDDDGTGVPEAQRATIFERFGRLEEGRTRDSGGAGLGLAVVQRIVERHHGSIAVGVSPMGGARFAVTLPPAE